MIQQAFGGYREWRTDDDDLDARTSGRRLLNALRTWADSLGPLTPGLLPFPLMEGPIELGVRVSGHRVDVALARARPTADCVSELPPGVHPFLPEDPY